MIKLATECNKCIHNKVCKNKDRARLSKDRLSNTMYDYKMGGDYDWDVMMRKYNVDVTFSCPDYNMQILKRGL